MFLRNVLVEWAQLCDALISCVRLSVCIKNKTHRPKWIFWSRSLIFQFINNTNKSHLCVPFASRLVSSRWMRCGRYFGVSFVRLWMRVCEQSRRDSASDSGIAKCLRLLWKHSTSTEEHYRRDKIEQCCCVPPMSNGEHIERSYESYEKWTETQKGTGRMPHSNVGHWCVTQIGQMSHLSTSEHYWILSMSPFHFSCALSQARLMTNSSMCICVGISIRFLEIFDTATTHYAVDVRQLRVRSTTTTTMSSPDINIGFYIFWIWCCICVN